MIDTTATRYRFKSFAKDVHVLDGWQESLQACGLNSFENFIALTGEVVDQNSRSVVHRIELGDPTRIFYLKCHKNYVKRKASAFFIKSEPMIYTELENMMHYARAGFDALDPVAWGWQKDRSGGNSFLLIADLRDYTPLQAYLDNDLFMASAEKRRAISSALSSMLAAIHDAGLAHRDFFTWHIFIKPSLSDYKLQPIDLERSMKKEKMIWSSFRIKKKQIDDLASLHLTVPWPLVNFSERMRFFHDYRIKRGMSGSGRKLLKAILKRAKHKGGRRKFKPYGVARKLRA